MYDENNPDRRGFCVEEMVGNAIACATMDEGGIGESRVGCECSECNNRTMTVFYHADGRYLQLSCGKCMALSGRIAVASITERDSREIPTQ